VVAGATGAGAGTDVMMLAMAVAAVDDGTTELTLVFPDDEPQ